jgi:hypothetical protein
MKGIVLRLSVLLVAVTAVVLVAVAAAPHHAAAVDFFGGLCSGAGKGTAACSGNGQDNISGTNGIILRASALISIVAGVAAVIAIMMAGFMFITAGGDSNRISTAKKTVSYAIVGLVIIVLARAIVVFVIGNI